MSQFVQSELISATTEQPLTRRGHERCLALLLSANELFLERGYEAVSLDDIVNHAGGSKASIYKFFGNKEGLFTAICDYRREEFFKDICTPFDFEQDDLRHYLVHTLLNFQRRIILQENAAFFRLILEQAQRNSEIAQYIQEQGPKHIQNFITHALSSAHDRGLIHCPRPDYSAQFYFGIIRDLEWRVLMNIHPTDDEQETVQYINYCVDRFLDGHQ